MKNAYNFPGFKVDNIDIIYYNMASIRNNNELGDCFAGFHKCLCFYYEDPEIFTNKSLAFIELKKNI